MKNYFKETGLAQNKEAPKKQIIEEEDIPVRESDCYVEDL